MEISVQSDLGAGEATPRRRAKRNYRGRKIAQGQRAGCRLTIRFDERNVYSASGKAYPRRAPRGIHEVDDRRLPYLKRVPMRNRKGYHWYFNLPPDENGKRSVWPLPHPSDIGFDHAYLNCLARLEGQPELIWQTKVKMTVYFIRAGSGAIKIGIAKSPKRRMAELQCSHHETLEIAATTPGGRTSERAYHLRFKEHHIRGEWFHPHPDILAEIERLARKAPA